MTNILKRLYEELILKKATTNSPLDPDSDEALYGIDESGSEHEFICVENFSWQRSKSNLCVKKRVFSFYYVRYAYNDPDFTYTGISHLPNRNKGVGCIRFEHGEPDILLLTEEISVGGTTRIISALQIDEFTRDGSIYERRKMARQKRNESIDVRRSIVLKKETNSLI
ncbi:hypothetical protein LQZ19_15345 [Treponema primitia]|uniref:hypothetical protein n=1 Tax=Treponema primitia TaxID=88058 RepID=UPI00398034BC